MVDDDACAGDCLMSGDMNTVLSAAEKQGICGGIDTLKGKSKGIEVMRPIPSDFRDWA